MPQTSTIFLIYYAVPAFYKLKFGRGGGVLNISDVSFIFLVEKCDSQFHRCFVS